jgi:putative transposase
MEQGDKYVVDYRHKCISNQMMVRLKEITNFLFDKWKCKVMEINDKEDHIQILFEAPLQISLANTVNSYKTVTSSYIRKEFEEELRNSTETLFLE